MKTPKEKSIVFSSDSGVAGGWSTTGSASARAAPALEPGTVLGDRYEILALLGEGGMGAVFKARDLELDRLVALKIVHPEMSRDPAVLQRFKQELILARQISHKNVIRIHDLGEAQGIKFITMDYIEGDDLASILKQQGKVAPAQAVEIVEQVALALEAAHAEGVVHRDLKPQNIMRDRNGRLLVMDFGLARSDESVHMTQTGALLGTMEYMAPEQALGAKVDGRSDLYALGLIFYQLLTGGLPFQAESSFASLVKRTREAAPSPATVDPSVPPVLCNIILKCLHVTPDQRYQSASELLTDLRAWKAGHTPSTATAKPLPQARWRPGRYTLMGVLALLAVLSGILVWEKVARTPKAPTAPVVVLVADFQNTTGDSVLDGTLEPVFTLGLEMAGFINSYPRNQALKIGAQLQPGANSLDQKLAELVAVREGINVVIGGSIVRQGDGYKITVKASDAVTAKQIGTSDIEVKDKPAVLQSVGSLAAKVRHILGDTTPESIRLAQAETFSSGSLEAAHEYARAQELRFAGKSEEAVKLYLRAIELDANFGSAYAALATMYSNLGQREAAIKYFNLALANIGRMTDREKYRTRGGYYLVVQDPQKAVEEFSSLAQQYPADTMGHSSLAYANYLRRDLPRALEEGRKALAIYPKNVPYRNNVALYAMYAGDFETAATEGRRALELNPSYIRAYVTVALSELAQGRKDKAEETYRSLEKISALGASFATSGLADVALYESRAADAGAILEQGIAANLADKNDAAAAKKSVMLAESYLLLGRSQQAMAALDRAVALSRESVLFSAARVYVELGQDTKATALATQLGAQVESIPQASAKLIEGEIQLKRGNAREAIRLFQESQKLADTWLARFDLGRAYLDARAFPDADSEFDLCLKRRGEATDVFFDEVATYRYLPAVYYYLGRVREGMNSPAAGEAYRSFLSLKAKGAADPLIVDAQRRLGGSK